MSKDPMQPGQAFHLPAAQQANVKNLLKVLGSKPATEALKEIGKTKDSAWKDIKESIINCFYNIKPLGEQKYGGYFDD